MCDRGVEQEGGGVGASVACADVDPPPVNIAFKSVFGSISPTGSENVMQPARRRITSMVSLTAL